MEIDTPVARGANGRGELGVPANPTFRLQPADRVVKCPRVSHSHRADVIRA